MLAEDTLADLHDVLQGLFSWSGKEPYKFLAADGAGGDISSAAPLKTIFNKREQKLVYQYGGESPWRVSLVAERLGQTKTGVYYPWMSAASGMGPMEDIGGVEEYNALVAALKNPEDARHGAARRVFTSMTGKIKDTRLCDGDLVALRLCRLKVWPESAPITPVAPGVVNDAPFKFYAGRFYKDIPIPAPLLTEAADISDFAEEDPEAARALYGRLLQEYPGNAWLMNNLAMAHRLTGNEAAATALIGENHRLNPQYIMGTITYIQTLMEDGKWSEVEEIFKARPTFAHMFQGRTGVGISEVLFYYHSVAHYSLHDGDVNKAQEMLAAARQLAPDSEVVRNIQAALMFHNLPECAEFLRRAAGKSARPTSQQ